MCTCERVLSTVKISVLSPRLQAVLNMGCCCLFLLASFVQSIVFGKLQLVEQQVSEVVLGDVT